MKLSVCHFSYLNIHKCIIVVLFWATLLTLPAHWFWSWQPVWAYWHGGLVDYWVPKVAVSMVALTALWIFSVPAAWKRPRVMPHFRSFFLPSRYWIAILLILFLTLNAVGAARPYVSLVFWGQLLAGPVSLWWWLRLHPASRRWLATGVIAAVFLQALIGLFQMLAQRPLIGEYWFWGEVSARVFPHLTTSTILPWHWVLPRGTTAHPNVLAGWLVLGLLLLWRQRRRLTRSQLVILGTIFAVVLLGTESVSAWITLGIVLLYQASKHHTWLRHGILVATMVMALTLTLVLAAYGSHSPHLSLSRRGTLLSTALAAGVSWQGMGPLHHISTTADALLPGTGIFYAQPVHSVPVALLLDFGLCILFLLSLFIILEYKMYTYIHWLFLLSLPIFSLDHFGLTILSGQFLLFLFFVFFSQNNHPEVLED